MNKLNTLTDSSWKNHNSNDGNPSINNSNNKLEKILCNHCGRTASNGIRCRGICVADNEY